MASIIETLWKKEGFKPNAAQREAILYGAGPLYLPAGPGSGKTRVLLWRTVHLIADRGVKPDRIFLSTFTEKAALQLENGLKSFLAMATDFTGQPYDTSRMYIGTMHSLCAKLLRDRRFRSGPARQRAPIILDELGQYFFIYRTAWGEVTGGLEGDDQEKARRINRIFDSESASRHSAAVHLITVFNRFSEESIDPARPLSAKRSPAGHDESMQLLFGLYRRYRAALAAGGIQRADLSLLQQQAYDLLAASPQAGPAFEQVIIDEYQDTNTIQEKIVFLLAGRSKNLCVVGDDDQSLYRFRGATVENFVRFPERCRTILGVEPHSIPLVVNYRSRKAIVDFSRAFIESQDWIDDGGNWHRVRKNLDAASRDTGISVVVSTPADPQAAVAQVVDLVDRIIKEGKVQDPNQVAFIFPALKGTNKRPNVQLTRFEKALSDRGYSVYAPRAHTFLENDEVRAMIGAMLVLFDNYIPAARIDPRYKDWLQGAWARGGIIVHRDPLFTRYVEERQAEIGRVLADAEILNGCLAKRRILPESPYEGGTLRSVLAAAEGLSPQARTILMSPAFERLASRRAREGRPFPVSYALRRATSLDWNVLDLFYRFCAFGCFRKMFDRAVEGDEKSVCNLALLSQYLDRFIAMYGTILTADFLAEDRFRNTFFGSYLLAIYRLGETEFEDPDDPFPKGSIPFLTVHQSKGLEFPVVVFANPRTGNKGTAIEEMFAPYVERDGEPLDRISDFDTNRVFYVAMSRAQHLLVIPHWKGSGSFPDARIKHLLEAADARIPDFDTDTLPACGQGKPEIPRTYSYSGDYLGYHRCPRQYMLFNKYGFAPSRAPTMMFGSLVHRTIEDLHRYLIEKRGGKS
jgi:DNA helicase-2/ATP-dependent DNA helicase PcrA